MTFADRVIKYYQNLKIDAKLPKEIEVLNPYLDADAMRYTIKFYHKFYNDSDGRRFIIGINPGRYGAGVTGIPFTDPVALEEGCGILNNLNKRKEISSEFVYMLIERMGGPEHFYKHFYIGSVSSLGFIKSGKNFNYYDSHEFYRIIKPTLISNLISQIGLGINSRKCYCLGKGKNYEYLMLLNSELKIFDEITPLPHPRWVMQYRRKKIDKYLEEIINKLTR